jgi:hypothetical protein
VLAVIDFGLHDDREFLRPPVLQYRSARCRSVQIVWEPRAKHLLGSEDDPVQQHARRRGQLLARRRATGGWAASLAR